MTILVTGSSGFLGSWICQQLVNDGHAVWAIDRHPTTVKGVNSVLGTVGSETLCALESIPLDAIIHCAGGSSVGRSIANPGEDFESTLVSLSQLLEFCRKFQPECRILFPSSASVYGNYPSSVALAESNVGKAESPYGLHKQIAETLLDYYHDKYAQKITIVRLFSLYGDGLKKQIVWDACKKFSGKDGTFFGTGDEVRDFLHVSDVVRLFSQLLTDQWGRRVLVNAGAGEGVSVRRLLELLATKFNYVGDIRFNGFLKDGDPRCLVADVSRLSVLGFRAKVSLSEGLGRYVKWFKDNERRENFPLL